MQYCKLDNNFFMRVNKGEEILQCIKTLCEKESITTAYFTGIGAVNQIEVGAFDTLKKEYYSKKFQGTYEITALNGNVTTMDGKVYIHAHTSFSDIECMVYGGHLNSAVVSATAEIVISCLSGSVGRTHDPDIGLNLLNFDGIDDNKVLPVK